MAAVVYAFLIALVLCTSCNKAWTQELTLQLSGAVNTDRGILNLLCTPSSESVDVNNIITTINGNSARTFGVVSKRIIDDRQIEFTIILSTPSNNSLVAFCQFGTLVSNSFNFSFQMVPITFNASQSSLILPEELNITCNGITDEVDPNNITLRLNGVAVDVASVTMGRSKEFFFSSTLLPLNSVVAQCTFGPMLGSLPGVINVQERVCEDCMDQYFCNGSSFCYPSTAICDSSVVSLCGEACEMLDQRTCDRCEPMCNESEYFCVSPSSCLAYTTLCDKMDDCDNGCRTPFPSDENADFCNSCVKEEKECKITEYFCRTTNSCLPYSTLCNGSVECQLTCFNATNLRTDEGSICGAGSCNFNEINCVFQNGSSECVAPSSRQICTDDLQCTNVCRDTGEIHLTPGEIAGIVVGVVGFIAMLAIIVVIILYFGCCREKKQKSDKEDFNKDTNIKLETKKN